MVRNIQLRVALKEEAQEGILQKKAAHYLGIPEGDFTIKIHRCTKTIDLLQLQT